MIIEMEKVVDLEFNELATINLIESNQDLSEIFTDEINTPYNILKDQINKNGLTNKTKEVLKEIFEKLVLTQSVLANRYVYLAKVNNINIPIPAPKIAKKLEVVLPEIKKPKNVKKEKSLPRRYGADKIKRDIKGQSGVVSPLQKAMLSLNTLKNIITNINNRAIKKMFTDSDVLSDEDCRTIVSVVKIAEQKLENILKKK